MKGTAELSLKDSEARYCHLFEAAQDGILMLDARTGMIEDVNPYLIKMLGYSRAEFLKKKLWEVGAFKHIEASQEAFQDLQEKEYIRYKDLPLKAKDGRLIQVEFVSNVYLVGDKKVIQCNIRDITEHQRIIVALQENEKKYYDLVNQSPDGVFIIELSGKILTVNKAMCKGLEYSEKEFLSMSIWDIIPEQYLDQYRKSLTKILEGKSLEAAPEYAVHGKDGRIHHVEVLSAPHYSGKDIIGFQGIARDITERKRAENKLRESEERFRSLYENATLGIYRTTPNGEILLANPALINMLGYSSFAELSQRNLENKGYEPEYPRNIFRQTIESVGEVKGFESAWKRKDGATLFVRESSKAIQDAEGKFIYYEGTVEDITEQKRAEQEIVSLAKFPSENPNPVLRLSRDGIVLYANAASSSLLGMWGCAMGGSAPQFWRDLVAQALASRENKTVDMECNGKVYSMIVTPVAESGYVNLYGRDITERKQAEESLRESEERVTKAFRSIPEALVISRLEDGKIVEVNDSWYKVFGYSREEVIGKNSLALNLFADSDDRQRAVAMLREQSFVRDFELQIRQKSGALRTAILSIELQEIQGEQYMLTVVQDITERKQAEERIQRQLEHLTALSAIDRVIASIFDLQLCLSEILTHVTMELGVDAADILILNSNSHMLEYSVEHGFRSKAVRKAQVRLGESYAGHVALERHLVQIPNLKNEPDNLSLKIFVTDEDFVCYFGVPLIFKGQLNGVLEVFHRTAFEPDEEWFDFLYALAGQAAIAIENSTLFESLQRSNSELTLAYDATIEGWSHALDLRDKETEGHTQRVTEMTVKLARSFGLSEAELAQVRWGALLHDIGKMGVPDNILLKPGPLTDEEWVAMKKHPTFAYEMLSPIRYLRLALDIPYCHHEKWDGSGYPRGLKGNQIPLVARIFAVVDVWDALRSDRPYRRAWDEEKVREHIHTSSGTHFDPQVVLKFFLEHG